MPTADIHQKPTPSTNIESVICSVSKSSKVLSAAYAHAGGTYSTYSS
jgi:hypothetical protein